MEIVQASLLVLLSTQTLIGYTVLPFRSMSSRFESANQKSMFGKVAVQGPETSLRGSRKAFANTLACSCWEARKKVIGKEVLSR